MLFFIRVLPFLIQSSELFRLKNGVAILPMIMLLVATLIIVLALSVNPFGHQEKTFLNPSLKSVRCLQTRVSFDRLLLLSFVLTAINLGAKETLHNPRSFVSKT